MPQISDPKQLFVHKLGATLTMEKTVLQMLQKLQQTAQSDELKQQFSHHEDETRQQVQNLEKIFQALGKSPEGQRCPTIEGLKTEGEEMIEQTDKSIVDAVLLGGAAETEHHEIAVYDGLITLAEELDEQDDVVSLLQENLEQEEHTLKEVEKAQQKLAKELAKQTA
jgi:ferritin-like metal-binding protein YciE